MRSNVYTFLRTVGLTRNKLVPFQINKLHPELTVPHVRMSCSRKGRIFGTPFTFGRRASLFHLSVFRARAMVHDGLAPRLRDG